MNAPTWLGCGGIATTTFYEWVARYPAGPCGRDLDGAHLLNVIVRIHWATNGTYGSPTIHAQLQHLGWLVNHKRAERLMRQNAMVGVFKPAKVRTTIPADDNFEIPDWCCGMIVTFTGHCQPSANKPQRSRC